ncbi:tegument protein UL96 [Cynomolgus macaque cytomegalovirus strain Ottawa]|uniref:Tegument protein UL96 n=2 Tax=Cytomegalovirus TaxID=10358 RepID=G8H0L8_9BETA|nr:tegument protein UL96 [Cynomolgus macaque cytomegalovirus strain Ottawa]YP_009337535.1 Cy131 [Cynomolgus cytomegalovirus]AKT72825.1 protein UL96 [Cynomolgus macaque cytomegalovirus strain Mauritius]AXG21835.1 protein UL96 [synthetic construct]AEQ32216.1 tegument protein UL96 [Cynomolgus macaque cytomegalovirus strain Ottawa]APT39298.1 Cy131 [Cynomolgus cytomegalovirus]APT39487.1 Cy131 [Cynomolgus cytomegalovirus]
MTSANKNLLKEAMRLSLEKQQNQFLRRVYGPRHRVTSHHSLQLMRVAAREQTRYSQAVVGQVTENVVRDREDLKRELQRARVLQKAADVDNALDSLIELKDTVEDVRDSFVDSVASTCEVDLLEGDDTE